MSGQDFDTGSATSGWKCLKFAMTMPMYYQYHYQKGAGWVVPSNAPGADGFEAAARGDLDGNGTYSTFARTGKVQGGMVVVSTNIYVDNEFE
jgi:type IV pilus assembly protein PilA